MSIQVAVTPKELRTLRTLLTREKELVCLDSTVYVKALLVAQNLLLAGKKVTAKIIKPVAVGVAGQAVVEYAVMLAVIAVLVIGTVRLIGSGASSAFSNVNSAISGGQ